MSSFRGVHYKTSPGGTCIANVTCYAPQGTPYAVSIGQTSTFTGLNVTESYNTRLQPGEIKAQVSGSNPVIDITYNFVDPASTHNAGHVYGITNNIDNARSQTFTYDQLNRIVSAQTTSTFATAPTKCWGEVYTLDASANLNSIAATTNSSYTGCSQESGFSQTAGTNNRLPNFGYDTAGNTTSDGVNSYTWDAQSQMKTAAGVTYGYDGEGRRVSKSSGKLYWYGSGGEILAETNSSGGTTAEYIFFGGKRIAMLPATGNAQFYVEDMLGSSRIVTTNAGVVCYDADFYPYGGERTPYTNNCPTSNNYKFEGKERDTETGNDDFGARYYSNRFGRWLSTDWSAIPAPVPYANLTNPQTLNLYSMVGDDPESFADLDGHMRSDMTGEVVHGIVPDCYMCITLASNLTPAEMDTLQQQAVQASQTPAQATQQQTQNQPNTLSDAGAKWIACQEEGCTPKLAVYDDGLHFPTIGFGHVVQKGEDFSKGITEAQAIQLFKQDAQKAINVVNSNLNTSVTQKQFDALVSVAFNSPRNAKSLVGMINQGQAPTKGDFVKTIEHHAHEGPNGGPDRVYKGLVNRRSHEADLYLKGIYTW